MVFITSMQGCVSPDEPTQVTTNLSTELPSVPAKAKWSVAVSSRNWQHRQNDTVISAQLPDKWETLIQK